MDHAFVLNGVLPFGLYHEITGYRVVSCLYGREREKCTVKLYIIYSLSLSSLF